MNSCTQEFSLEVQTGCVPDTGPPVPLAWANPQPAGIKVTGYDASAFQIVPVCPGGTSVQNWDGTLPVMASTGPGTLIYATAGSTFFVFSPRFVQGQSCLCFVQFFGGVQWKLSIRCESSLQDLWLGSKTVGLTPIGTYMRVVSTGSADLPLCLHIAEL